jgi:hypothetical protein
MLSEKLSSIAEESIKLDVKYLYHCFYDNYKNYPGATNQSKQDIKNKCMIPKPIGLGMSEEEATLTSDYAHRQTQFLQWVFGGFESEGSQWSTGIQKKLIKQFPIKIYCSETIQDISVPPDENECKKTECVFNIKLTLLGNKITDRSRAKGWTLATYIKYLIEKGPVGCGISANSMYVTNKESTNNDSVVVWDSSTDSVPLFTDLGHAATLIGYRCDSTHIYFIFKDSYLYPNNRDSIFEYKFLKNQLSQYAPFVSGIQFGGSGSVFVYGIEIDAKEQQRIKNMIKKVKQD